MKQRRAQSVILAEIEALLADPEIDPIHPELRDAYRELEP